MLIDELLEQLKEIEPDVIAIKDYWANSKIQQRFEELDIVVNQDDFWKHPERDAIVSEQRALRQQVEDYHAITKQFDEEKEMVEMFADNEAELQQLTGSLYGLRKKVRNLKLMLLLQEEHDSKDCYLSINAGAGGTESQDWADILLRMYLRFCERNNFKVAIIDHQSGEEAGIKGATLSISGPNAYGILRAEAGIHRLVRISPFDANKRRHTSFAGVTIIPEAASEKIDIDEKDLRIDTYRAGGAGGQHVNKTDSAVRITHIPTNTVVQCQNERSQLQNKQTAMKLLKSRLTKKMEEEQKAKENSVEKKKIEWGSQIRSYVLHPYKMVKDHRTDFESPRPDDVLDGDLMPFIEAYLYAQ